MRKSIIAGVLAGALLAIGAGTSANAVESGKAELFVLHGVPATPVDVYVNGDLALPNFQPGTLTAAIPLAPGSYTFDLTAVGDGNNNNPILSAGPVTLAADTSYTAVAHLDAAAAPKISLFTNDLSPTASGEGRLTVRHVAAAPAVDVLANGTVAFAGLVNPNEVKADLPVATYTASVNLAGTSTVAIPDTPISLAEGVNLIVYAWGNAGAQPSSLAVATQTIDTMMNAPSGVSAGSAPVPSDGSTPIALVVVAALALVGAAFATRTAVASRR